MRRRIIVIMNITKRCHIKQYSLCFSVIKKVKLAKNIYSQYSLYQNLCFYVFIFEFLIKIYVYEFYIHYNSLIYNYCIDSFELSLWILKKYYQE